MDLPPLIRRLLDAKFQTWCANRVPTHVRDKLRYEHETDGNVTTLLEIRPRWDGSPGETRSPVAQIRYEDDVFALYCADRNGDWHFFEPFQPTKDLDAVIAEIERDTTGIFFG